MWRAFWKGLSPAHKMSFLQVLVGLLSVCAWWLKGPLAAYSSFLGGVIAIVPQLFFARKAFAKHGARAARQILGTFYVGEVLKWLSSITLFTLVFVNAKPDAVALISAYAVTQLVVPLFALLVIKNNQG